MRFLDNLKISSKILSVVGLLSTVIVLILVVAGFSLHNVDAAYSQLTVKDDPSVLAMARASRAVNMLGYGVYRAIAYPGNSAEAQTAARMVEDSYNGALKFLDTAVALRPREKDQLERFRDQMRAIHDCAMPVVALGLKDENDQAIKAMVRCDAMISEFVASITKFNDADMARVAAASAATSASATSTIFTTSGIGVAGLRFVLCSACGSRSPRSPSR
jgi:Four helix bundle sensory module for signal transduction